MYASKYSLHQRKVAMGRWDMIYYFVYILLYNGTLISSLDYHVITITEISLHTWKYIISHLLNSKDDGGFIIPNNYFIISKLPTRLNILGTILT